MPGKRVTVGGVSFDALTEDHVVSHVRGALGRGQGGWILTPNVDILRQLRRDPRARAVLAGTTLVVADGMPVVWASRLAGTPLPQRVCGSDLIWSLSRGLGEDGRSVFILGGEPVPSPREHRNEGPEHALRPVAGRARNEVPTRYAGPDPGADGADRAATQLRDASPGLRVVGAVSPPFGFDGDPGLLAGIRDEMVAARPDLVLVGIGFPRQERVIAALREHLPHAWFLGCGMAIGYVAGERRRAPVWMRRAGVEWVHRLASEPRRLADRYLRRDLPFAVSLLGGAALHRLRPRAAADDDQRSVR